MRFRTIWFTSGIPLSERLHRTADQLALSMAHHLPKRVRYWTALAEIGTATQNSKDIPATTLDEILKNMCKTHRRV